MSREDYLVNSISIPDDSPPLAIIADHTLDINMEGQKPKRTKSHKKKRKDNLDDSNVSGPVKELVIPLMMSAIGNLGAGLILDKIQNWQVFLTIPQLIALVPALLGLKGNVEMTLSSRLTTQAHLGHLNDRKIRNKFLIGNLALAQAQASGVGLLAPIIALGISCFQGKNPDSDNHRVTWPKALLTISASVVTSAVADLLLASTMCTIIIMTYFYCKVDVDNIATPIAASLGDLVTMGFLSGVSLVLFRIYNDPALQWLLGMPILFYLLVLSIVFMIARRNPHVSKQIIFGWNPLIVSMLIQNLSGMVMERFIREFPRMTVFQPIINGFGGNLVALQSSRVGTDLHKNAQKKEMINQSEKCCSFPWVFFFGKGRHGRLASVMVLIAAPFQMPFIIAASTLAGKSYLTPLFFLTYYVVSTAQVIVILYVGYCFVNFLWRVGINPDNSAIPILTALADLLGCLLLAFGFLFMAAFNDPNTIPDSPPPYPFNSTVFY